MQLNKLSIIDFNNETAADKAVPGGGCVSAVAASMGASLIEMVGHMTERKANKQAVEFDSEVKNAMDLATELRIKLVDLVNADAEAFDAVMAAFALPKSNDEEKAIRSKAIQNSYKNATNPPYEVAFNSMRLLMVANAVVSKGDSNALSDACVAVRMLNSAIHGAIYNVNINLSSIKDLDYVATRTAQVKEIIDVVDIVTNQILSNINI